MCCQVLAQRRLRTIAIAHQGRLGRVAGRDDEMRGVGDARAASNHVTEDKLRGAVERRDPAEIDVQRGGGIGQRWRTRVLEPSMSIAVSVPVTVTQVVAPRRELRMRAI
jgi:hypothetical protein